MEEGCGRRGGMARCGGEGAVPADGGEYHGDRVVGMVGDEDGEWMAGVVAEALRAKAARREGGVFEFEALGRKALEDRVGLGVRWEDCRDGGELRRGGHTDEVQAIVLCDGLVCSGSWDGSIRVWSRASGELEQTLAWLAGAPVRPGRGAPKMSAPGRGAGRCIKSGALLGSDYTVRVEGSNPGHDISTLPVLPVQQTR